MSIRIHVSNATATALHTCLQDAYRRDDVRLVRRLSVLIDLLIHKTSVSVICERWGLQPVVSLCLAKGLHAPWP